LGGFLGEINGCEMMKFFDQMAIKKADFQMQHSGTVAVGDVSNSVASLEVKHNSRLYYHTFSKRLVFILHGLKRHSVLPNTSKMFHEAGLSASVTPHSAYSVSESLFKMIKEKAATDNSILSIHNQESLAEEMFFKSCSGPIFNHLQHTLGLDVSHLKPDRKMLNRVCLFCLREINCYWSTTPLPPLMIFQL
jgi:aminodeoxyfutalosine deaminase